MKNYELSVSDMEIVNDAIITTIKEKNSKSFNVQDVIKKLNRDMNGFLGENITSVKYYISTLNGSSV